MHRIKVNIERNNEDKTFVIEMGLIVEYDETKTTWGKALKDTLLKFGTALENYDDKLYKEIRREKVPDTTYCRDGNERVWFFRRFYVRQNGDLRFVVGFNNPDIMDRGGRSGDYSLSEQVFENLLSGKPIDMKTQVHGSR